MEETELKTQKAALQSARVLREQRNLDAAATICNSLLRQHPDHLCALQLLALIFIDQGNYLQALTCLARAEIVDPVNWETLTALAETYLRLGSTELAEQAILRARKIQPKNPVGFILEGEIKRERNEFIESIDLFRSALSHQRDNILARIGLARSLAETRLHEEAGQIYTGLLKGGVLDPDIILAASMLPAEFVTIDLIQAIEKGKASPRIDRAELERVEPFIKAVIFDRTGNYAEAWRAMVQGNQTMSRLTKHSIEAQKIRQNAWLADLKNARDHIKTDSDNTTSLFILGPSRSGKSTLEFLLSSIQGVHAGGESSIVTDSINLSFQRNGFSPCLESRLMPPALLADFRSVYKERLTLIGNSKQIFINTSPHPITNAGWIINNIPNVKIVCVKRERLDLMLRIFMKLYTAANEFSYDLEAIGCYLDWYEKMVDILAEKFPKCVRVVNYNEIIDHPNVVRNEVASLCKLEEPANLPVHPGHDRGCGLPYADFLRGL